MVHLDEEAIYADIFSELKSDTLHQGVWAKAFSESEGDDNKSRALYIKLRFEQEIEHRRLAHTNTSQVLNRSPIQISGCERTENISDQEMSAQVAINDSDSRVETQTTNSPEAYRIEQRTKYQYWPSLMLGMWSGLTFNTFFRHEGIYVGWLPNIIVTCVASLIFMRLEDKVRKLLHK